MSTLQKNVSRSTFSAHWARDEPPFRCQGRSQPLPLSCTAGSSMERDQAGGAHGDPADGPVRWRRWRADCSSRSQPGRRRLRLPGGLELQACRRPAAAARARPHPQPRSRPSPAARPGRRRSRTRLLQVPAQASPQATFRIGTFKGRPTPPGARPTAPSGAKARCSSCAIVPPRNSAVPPSPGCCPSRSCRASTSLAATDNLLGRF